MVATPRNPNEHNALLLEILELLTRFVNLLDTEQIPKPLDTIALISCPSLSFTWHCYLKPNLHKFSPIQDTCVGRNMGSNLDALNYMASHLLGVHLMLRTAVLLLKVQNVLCDPQECGCSRLPWCSMGSMTSYDCFPSSSLAVSSRSLRKSVPGGRAHWWN